MTTQTAADERTAARRRRLVAYTRWIEELCRDDPGARIALRSGLRRDLDDVPRMHRFVAPWLPQNGQVLESEQRAYYAVAAMIAAQPRNSYATPDTPETDPAADPDSAASQETPAPRYGTSLGLAFALAVIESPGREREIRESTAESRLNLLTRQSLNGLHRHLPAAVRYLREVDVPIDWAQLLSDLIAWPTHSGKISRRWLQHYYLQRTRALHEHAQSTDQGEAENPNTTA
ncbi:type I-E CRISPR-associated protein Cse2/CasB [Streptomyces sp. CB02959]|uniref:type I-E CRISPR-associated protein Cse2/CasB n=1 Tax=Streptomyces sp. CB02959 TaxID=2020330 RepID=UPI000C27CAF0|nr:type I-E CRISPR-associated protein Cse2/CasB [Streptomyces sp. CB02959]PJN36630.1 type I-E CRISPR-associated protein Cse2/CasB [Streptomyces sp. CB02959]